MLLEVVDPLGRTIVLADETWTAHVAKRPELEGQLEYVREAVADPDLIVEAKDGSYRYYAAGVSPRYPNLYLHVLVRLTGENTGRIRSAWFSRTVEDGEFEWIRSELRKFGGS